MQISNKIKIRTFWGWFTVENKNTQHYYIEELVVFYKNEIRIKHMSNECWHMLRNQYVTHWHKINTWNATTCLTLRDYFQNDKKTIYSSILDCITAQKQGYGIFVWKYKVHLNLVFWIQRLRNFCSFCVIH